ncbi:MAG: PaaI family thioesterase [Candidatus Merdivicinus sp.]|jgi:acyl-CoA thioesterase
MKELDQIREYFADDRFATEAAGAVIEAAEDGYARCSMELKPIHRNARGAVMGGAIFTLADFAFAVASNCAGTGVVTLNSQISYLGTAKGTQLIAEAKRVKQGRSTGYYTVSIRDELGNPVAEVTGTGFVVSSK